MRICSQFRVIWRIYGFIFKWSMYKWMSICKYGVELGYAEILNVF